MKRTVITLAAIAASVTMSQAAVTFGVKNFNSPADGLVLVDNAGVGVSATIAAGTFAGGFDFSQDAASILSGFSQNGNPIATFQNGMFNGQFGSTTNTATSTDGSDAFTGTAVYLLIAADFGAGLDYIVVDTGRVWPQEAPAVGAVIPAYTLDAGSIGDVVRGNAIAVTGGVNAPFDASPNGVTYAIPEPSSALLLGLGGLGLLIRRKR